jgi:hypothetical protein
MKPAFIFMPIYKSGLVKYSCTGKIIVDLVEYEKTAQGNTKKEAKALVCLDFLNSIKPAYLKNSAPLSCSPDFEKLPERINDIDVDIDENYIGDLNSYCQKNKTRLPKISYTSLGPVHNPIFIGEMDVTVNNRHYSLKRSGATKKILKHGLSKNILAMIKSDTSISTNSIQIPTDLPERISAEEIEGNFVGELYLFSLKSKPKYYFKHYGPSHDPIYVCKCEFNFNEKLYSIELSGSAKKLLKQVTSRIILGQLVDQIS